MKLKQTLFSLVAVALLILIKTWSSWPDEDIHVSFCDVGQGDAMLLSRGFTQVLVDTGEDESVLTCLSQEMPFWDKQIEWIFISHTDSDHCAGLVPILERYQAKNIIFPFLTDDNDLSYELFSAILAQKEGLESFRIANLGQVYQPIDDVSLEIIWPILSNGSKNRMQLAWYDDNSEHILEDIFQSIVAEGKRDEFEKNNQSTVIFLGVNDTSFLLTGDVDEQAEAAMLAKGLTKESHVLKVAHHGSKTSSSLDFLERIRPEKTVISVGQNNSFGHPSPEVIGRLEQIGAKILRTDKLGAINFVCNAQGCSLKNDDFGFYSF